MQKKYLSKNNWLLLTTILSIIISIPIIIVLFSILFPKGENWEHILNNLLWIYISDTSLLLILTIIFSTIIGVSCSWLCSNLEFPLRKIISWMLILPLACPGYIIAYVYADIFEYGGYIHNNLELLVSHQINIWPKEGIRSIIGASVILSFVLYPYIYILSRNSFIRSSQSLEETARILGASNISIFLNVSLPMARPAIIGGILLVTMEVIADFGVADYFGISTITAGIFRTWLSLGDRVSALQLSAGLFIFIIFIILLERFSRKGKVFNPDNNLLKLKRTKTKTLGYFISLFCLIPILVGFIIPTCILISFHYSSNNSFLDTDFVTKVFNSFYVASIASTLTLFIAIIYIYSDRIYPNKISKKLIEISTLGYVLPGAVIGLGVIIFLTWADLEISRLFLRYFSIETGLIFTGSIAALVFGYTIRFLTIAHNSCQSNYSQISGLIDDKGKVLGANNFRILKEIHFPLVLPAIISAWLLVFIEAIKELPATLILRPFNFETLSTSVYRFASDERIVKASSSSLLIIFLGFISVLILTRRSGFGIYSKK